LSYKNNNSPHKTKQNKTTNKENMLQQAMTSLDSDQPISLGNNIFLFAPCDNVEAPDAIVDRKPDIPPPKLVILCTWLGGATTSRVTKYTTGYRNIYPNAHILLVRTDFLDLAARSFETVRSRLAPARNAIQNLVQSSQQASDTENNKNNGILLHIFSHGGCNTALQLAISMSKTDPSENLLQTHLHQIIFDCCPGDASFQKAYNAAMLSVPHNISSLVRAISTIAVYSSVAMITGLQNLGLMSSVREMRLQLNDPAIFGLRGKILYLFSLADRMVSDTDVKSHAELAREKGYRVEMGGFSEAAHCALVMEDADKYWGCIQACWKGEVLTGNFGKVSRRESLL
jgi:hypothetical protein